MRDKILIEALEKIATHNSQMADYITLCEVKKMAVHALSEYNKAGEEPEDFDLQNQVREHIKNDKLFDWHELMTEYEMECLEQLLLTFNPLFQPGSIGYSQWAKYIDANRTQSPNAGDQNQNLK